MQSQQGTAKSFFEPRKKAQSFKHQKPIMECSKSRHSQFPSLSSLTSLTQSHRRISVQALYEYLEQVMLKIYEKDIIGIKVAFNQFVKQQLVKIRPKVQDRLSLLKYLEESIKYKSFGEIDTQMQKQWRKNPMFVIISTIWAKLILKTQFKSTQEFVEQYDKFRNYISNLTQYYFKESLRVLNDKNVETLTLIFEDSSHQIINNLKDWKEIYQNILLKFIQSNIKGQQIVEINLEFDLEQLKVSRHYLNLKDQANNLPETTQLIKQFAQEYKIHEKIALLRRIRNMFLQQINDSNKKIVAQLGIKKISEFQKDDVIDCMIYCIVKGQVGDIKPSLDALLTLLGRNTELLSKKGVDSYRADLQGAIQYLCENQSSSLIKIPKNLMSTRITLE